MKKQLLIILTLFLNYCEISNAQIIINTNITSPSLYNLYELTLQLPAVTQQYVNQYFVDNTTGLNPYDYSQIEVYSVFTSPSGEKIKASGFYYEGQTKTDNGGASTIEVLIPNLTKN